MHEVDNVIYIYQACITVTPKLAAYLKAHAPEGLITTARHASCW